MVEKKVIKFHTTFEEAKMEENFNFDLSLPKLRMVEYIMGLMEK
jgi:hypothetical protein